MYSKVVKIKNKLPPFYLISDFLWGKDADVDSEGNSLIPDSNDWNELTLILRSDLEQRVDIDPIENSSNTIKIKSEYKELIDKLITVLQKYGSI